MTHYEDKVTRRARSPETRRQRSQTTEGGLFQKRDRVNANDRRILLESLKKVHGWMESNDAATQSEAEEPTGREIADQLAVITLRDERDARLEREMKDNRTAIVPPVCVPDLDVTFPRERRPVKVSGGKMVSVKTSVISLEICDKSNFDVTLAMKKVNDRHEIVNRAAVDLHGDGEAIESWRDFGRCYGDGQTFELSGDRGGWDCDRLEKTTKFDGDLATLHEGDCAKLQSIALKLNDYTKLKSVAVAVTTMTKSHVSCVRKSNEDSERELISVKTSEIYPKIGRNKDGKRRHVTWGYHSETSVNSNETFRQKPQKRRQNVGTQNSERDFLAIRSVRSLGTDAMQSRVAETGPRRGRVAGDEGNVELIEILPPQFKVTDERQSEDEREDSVAVEAERTFGRKKRNVRFDEFHADLGTSGDWADAESKRVSTLLEQLNISPGRGYGLDDQINAETLPSDSYVVDEVEKKDKQRDGYKPEWLRNYSAEVSSNEGPRLVDDERKTSEKQRSSWEKKNSVKPTSLGIHKADDAPHLNSVTRDERDTNPVRVVSASATSVANVVLAELRDEKNRRRDQHDVAKKGGASATRDITNSKPCPRRSTNKREDRISAREISTGTDDGKDMNSSDTEQARLLSQANLFKRPSFTLDPLREIRNKERNVLPPSASLKRDLVKLERQPIRRRVSNEELDNTKREINKLLSKTSEILLRNGTERPSQGNALSLYREVAADLRHDSTQQRNVNANTLNVNTEDSFELADVYAGGHGYDSDGSGGDCPMNSLVSLVYDRDDDDDDEIEESLLPRKVAAKFNLLQAPQDRG